jgi:D-xylose reductase
MQAANSLTHLALHNGAKMPTVGFGMWKISKDVCAEATYQAIKAGYRLLDEACDYGNEKECGEGIKRAIDEGLIKREDLWVTSKLWNTSHRKEYVKAACQKSLSDLGLEYLDLYLIHFPIALKYVDPSVRYPAEWIHDPASAEPRMEEDNVPYQETWKAMEELVKEGLVKNIGSCNIGCSMLRDVMNYAEIKPSVLQVEMHPLNTQEKLLRFC